MKILWIIFIVWSIEQAPLMKPFEDECKRVGGILQFQRIHEYVLSTRCIKIDTKEPERVPNTYSVG